MNTIALIYLLIGLCQSIYVVTHKETDKIARKEPMRMHLPLFYFVLISFTTAFWLPMWLHSLGGEVAKQKKR